MFRKKQAYRATFYAPNGTLHDAGGVVLRDIANYCHAMQPPFPKDMTGKIDPIEMARMMGRHEVWSRMVGFLDMPYRQQTELAIPAQAWMGDEP